MMKFNKSEIMKNAWRSFKANETKTFAQALKNSWAAAKNPVITVAIKKWFANKMDLGYGKKLGSRKATVVRETEKAYLLNVEWYSVDGEYDGVQNEWCPKSCTMSVEEAEVEEQKEIDRMAAGADRYQKLIAFAKANGVKGVRVGLRAKTIEKKIADAGLKLAI